MADDDPDPAYSDKGIDDFAEDSRGNFVMDYKSEQGARDQSRCPCAHHGQICQFQPSEDQADHQYHQIIETQECLDRGQVFLFSFRGGQKIQGSGRSAGCKQPVADAADDSQDRS